MTKAMRTKYNLIYRLRRKGISVITRQRTIEAEGSSKPMEVRQIRRLVNEYGFAVQYLIHE